MESRSRNAGDMEYFCGSRFGVRVGNKEIGIGDMEEIGSIPGIRMGNDGGRKFISVIFSCFRLN